MAKWSGVVTPYRYRRPSNGRGWAITFGVSGFLVAEGSAWSTSVGTKLLSSLNDEHMKRAKARRPAKRRI